MDINPTILMLILVGLQILREILGLWREQKKADDPEE